MRTFTVLLAAALAIMACTSEAGDDSNAASTTTTDHAAARTRSSETPSGHRARAPSTAVVATGTGAVLVDTNSGETLRQLGTERLDGRVVGFGEVAVAADGRTVYVTATIGSHRREIHRVDIGGEGVHVALGTDVAITDDASRLAYAAVPSEEAEGSALREDLVVRELATGAERRWEHAAPRDPDLVADLRSLSWAPDGQHLAFELQLEDGVEVRVLDTTTGTTVLDSSELEPSSTDTAYAVPEYRGSSGFLAVVAQRGGVDPAIAPERYAIVTVDPRSGEVARTLVESDRPIVDLDFDPSGQHLLYVTTHRDHGAEAPRPNRLHRWSVDGTEVVPLEREPVSASW